MQSVFSRCNFLSAAVSLEHIGYEIEHLLILDKNTSLERLQGNPYELKHKHINTHQRMHTSQTHNHTFIQHPHKPTDVHADIWLLTYLNH